MSIITEKIAAIKSKMATLDPVSPEYVMYQEVIDELSAREFDGIVVHKSPEPELCESCQ